MPRTKKVKAAGRLGARYGVKIRKSIVKIEAAQRQKYVCKKCGKRGVKRIGTGIWECKSCGHKFAGGTYTPSTPSSKMYDKIAKAGGAL
jgi:large subunit ribosomal protein L37Ae